MRNQSLDVRYLICFGPDADDGDAKVPCNTFRAHPIPLMRAQADSIRLELLFVPIPKETTDYMKAYVDGIRRVRDEYGIKEIWIWWEPWSGIGSRCAARGPGAGLLATSRCGRRIASNVCAPC
jgi:hypothetical protein